MKGLLRCYDVTTGKETVSSQLLPPGVTPGEPMRLAVSPNGRLLAVAADARVMLVRLDTLLAGKKGR
jgi:hypothetical protein